MQDMEDRKMGCLHALMCTSLEYGAPREHPLGALCRYCKLPVKEPVVYDP